MKACVRQLPKIPSYALPRDATCPVCVQPYENQTTDSGSFEKAVCLPCNDNHIIGSECLSKWLTYGDTCPLCRHEISSPNAEEDEGIPNVDVLTHIVMTEEFHTQCWEEYWYVAFWILHLQGDREIERKWRLWKHDWTRAADQCDESSRAHAKAALSLSPMMGPDSQNHEATIRATAVAINTRRFREYLLYHRLRADGSEYPELKTPPGFQLTLAQEDALFGELLLLTGIGQREQWDRLRDLGFGLALDWMLAFGPAFTMWSTHPY